MTLEQFKESLKSSAPPAGMSDIVLALWYDARNDWKAAHETAQEINTKDGARVHAYLHRKEGDHSNAGYWYTRAGSPIPRDSLESEFDTLVHEFLSRT